MQTRNKTFCNEVYLVNNINQSFEKLDDKEDEKDNKYASVKPKLIEEIRNASSKGWQAADRDSSLNTSRRRIFRTITYLLNPPS